VVSPAARSKRLVLPSRAAARDWSNTSGSRMTAERVTSGRKFEVSSLKAASSTSPIDRGRRSGRCIAGTVAAVPAPVWPRSGAGHAGGDARAARGRVRAPPSRAGARRGTDRGGRSSGIPEPGGATSDRSDVPERLTGRRVASLGRTGKFLFLPLDAGLTWVVHLGMSGRVQLATIGEAGADPHPLRRPDRTRRRGEARRSPDVRLRGRPHRRRGGASSFAALGPDALTALPGLAGASALSSPGGSRRSRHCCWISA
jgi:hypothetical protein